ncbi:Uncharacterized conserved protein [Kingella potus]|uniref:Uncharacterized conserved protein n=1 Tax=Kingella potus TaxID=265175 RepID=A0A377R3L6_9NEIS|nr:DUF302 domain-containing protein [Kingella potus]UOP00737.1 DUF302 domain-containing protein [Kingella potus]STR02859.1 Uncharacterized conserved protein [Kingella potus]
MKFPTKPVLSAAAALALAACAAPLPSVSPSDKEQIVSQPSRTHSISSRYGFAETVSRLQQAVRGKGMTVFAVIDHQAAARKAGLDMQPATVIVFGAPKAGTPLMIKDPDFALQLPLKVLVTESGGQVRAVFNDTRALLDGSGIAVADVENSLIDAAVLMVLIEKTVSE